MEEGLEKAIQSRNSGSILLTLSPKPANSMGQSFHKHIVGIVLASLGRVELVEKRGAKQEKKQRKCA